MLIPGTPGKCREDRSNQSGRSLHFREDSERVWDPVASRVNKFAYKKGGATRNISKIVPVVSAMDWNSLPTKQPEVLAAIDTAYADDQAALFYLPPPPHSGRWRLAIDTNLPSPHDIRPSGAELELEPALTYRVRARSLVVLLADWGPKTLWAEPVKIRPGEKTGKHARRNAKRADGQTVSRKRTDL